MAEEKIGTTNGTEQKKKGAFNSDGVRIGTVNESGKIDLLYDLPKGTSTTVAFTQPITTTEQGEELGDGTKTRAPAADSIFTGNNAASNWLGAVGGIANSIGQYMTAQMKVKEERKTYEEHDARINEYDVAKTNADIARRGKVGSTGVSNAKGMLNTSVTHTSTYK